MEEDFYYEESSSKHVFLKCLIILFIIGLCVGIFMYYKKENTITLKNVTVELGSELSKNVDDYLKSGKKYSSNYKLYLNNVDVNTIGRYTYKVKYNKHTKTGYINVVDTTIPEVSVLEEATIGKNEEFNPNLLVNSCKDASMPCKVYLKNDSDYDKLSILGTYNIDVVISDNAGNEVVKTVKITVSETGTLSSNVTSDLEYYTNSENDEEISHILFAKLDKAIEEDSKEYKKLILDVSQEDFSKYVDDDIYSTKLITAYNKYGYVIGIQVQVTFKNGTKKIIEKKVVESVED